MALQQYGAQTYSAATIRPKWQGRQVVISQNRPPTLVGDIPARFGLPPPHLAALKRFLYLLFIRLTLTVHRKAGFGYDICPLRALAKSSACRQGSATARPFSTLTLR